jgi:hypothetical protein
MSSIEGIKLAKYDGTDKTKFDTFVQDLTAIGAIKGGFDEAYMQDLPTEPSHPGYTTADVAEENKIKIKLAWNHLILALTGTPRMLVMRIATKDPKIAWDMLHDRYKPTNMEAYTRINRDFENCEIEDQYKDKAVAVET